MPNFKDIIVKEQFQDILGQEDVKEQVKSALLMDRHIVIVGPPGIGKTTLAKNIAAILPDLVVQDCGYNCTPAKPVCPQCIQQKESKKIKVSGSQRFVRVQGSPDLTAEDLLGDIDPVKAMEFGAMSLEAFTPGKLFRANNGVLFFDELNRCPEKLQNALLQVLEEKKMTISGYTVDFDIDFIFIGTMNPEDTSTEPLSDVFVDRFDVVYMKYPETIGVEQRIVQEKGQQLVTFPDVLLEKTLRFIRKLRQDKDIEKKPSVRASIGLYERAQANAFLRGRAQVSEQDVADAVVSVLAHRIRLKPSKRYLTAPKDYVMEQYRQLSEVHANEPGDGP